MSEEEFTITPLGCAVVEAMPDNARINAIQVAFHQLAICLTSKHFDADAVRAFYAGSGREVTPVQLATKGAK